MAGGRCGSERPAGGSARRGPARRNGAEGRRVHVLFAGSINVGGRNRFPMAELSAALRASGCAGVRTWGQSGNAVFRAVPAAAREGADRVAAAIERRIGRRVPVVLRTAGDLAATVAGNPFPDDEGLAQSLHVGFMAVRPPADRIAALDPGRSRPDECAVRGREIYLRLPRGAARSKFTKAYFESVLGTAPTFRNWRTLRKLLETADR